jgi:hypothetical protein
MPSGAFVYNHDVVGLHRRINRFIEEFAHSQSSPWSDFLDHDLARARSYLNAAKVYKAWVVAQPQLDLPETHPREYTLDDNPPIPEIENESVRDLINLMILTRDEMTASQSARVGSGLLSFDAIRFDSIIAKAEAFLDNYVEPATPLDLPESSPMKEITPAGRGGT